MKGEKMELPSFVLELLSYLIGAPIFFLPAVVVKKLFLPRVKISTKTKVITMILLGIFTFTLSSILVYLFVGEFVFPIKWITWMIIDFSYLFRRKNKKDFNSQLYADITAYEESQSTESVPEKESIDWGIKLYPSGNWLYLRIRFIAMTLTSYNDKTISIPSPSKILFLKN